MNKLTIILGLMLLAAFQSLSQTQTHQQPSTPAECLKAVQDYQQQQMKAALAAGQRPDREAIQTKKVAMAKEYAARFLMASVAVKDLNALAQLYVEANQPELAWAAISRHLETPGISEAEHAATLEIAAGIALSPSGTQEGAAKAETYIVQLDALSDAVTMNKFNAHARIGDYYRYADMDEKILEHENKILALAKKVGPDERKIVGERLVESYINLAPVYGNRGEADQALAILRKGLAELAEAPNAKERINEAMQSYLLVGQPAAPIEAEYWINAEPETKRIDLRGQVTLLQFTAHWCGPCRKSYPAMLGFHERYAKDGLRVMFATKLYGFFEKQSGLKPEEELAANKKYYVEHHHLPFRIAVKQWKRDVTSDGKQESFLDVNEARYFIGGYPTIVVIDKQGIIRLMMYGWDLANESKLARLIEKLLAESVANSKH